MRAASSITVLIADAHPIVREGLRGLLAAEDDIEIVSEVGDAISVLALLEELEPDILLLELRLPDMDGLLALQELQRLNRKTKVIVLTASEDEKELVQAMKLGCSGIVPKRCPVELITKSIRKVHAGEIWLDTPTTAAVIKQFASPVEEARPAGVRFHDRTPLTTRELDVVRLLVEGYTNKEIAEKLFLSEQTVKNHLHNIFHKLGLSSRLEAALYAIHEGLHVHERSQGP